MFAGGLGTAESPYLIETAENLINVKEKYDSYNYFKVKDGVKTIDCSNWPNDVKLNGSFDGNGVELLNLTGALFRQLGYNNEVQEVEIGNFVANVNSTTALVHNLFNGGATTFKNIQMHGYIEAAYNIGSFYRYGTANFDDTGCNYTVNFVNCQSDVAIVETTGNVPGGLWGHAYPGKDFTATINVDDKTAYTGTLYGTAAKGCTYTAITGSVALSVNGANVDFSGDTNTYSNYTKFPVVSAVEKDDGWYLTKESSVTSLTISLNAQITAWNGETKVDNAAGITLVIDTKTITELSDSTKVFDAFTSVKLITGQDEAKAEIVDGVLKIYVKSNSQYTYDGTITLSVVQREGSGRIVSMGSVKIGDIVKE